MHKLQDFDYNLPAHLIAQKPVTPRDQSRLLVLDKNTGQIEHRHFFDLPEYLKSGDVLLVLSAGDADQISSIIFNNLQKIEAAHG